MISLLQESTDGTSLFGEPAYFNDPILHPDDNSIEVLNKDKLNEYYKDNFDQKTFETG